MNASHSGQEEREEFQTEGITFGQSEVEKGLCLPGTEKKKVSVTIANTG